MASMGNSNAQSNQAVAGKFAPNLDSAQGEPATFGAGCYWGTEKFFRKDFQKLKPGLTSFFFT